MTTAGKTSTKQSSSTKKIETWKDLFFWTGADYEFAKLEVQRARRTPQQEVLPLPHLMFRPLIETPLSKVKVVILGEEPYTMRGRPDGLAWSSAQHCGEPDQFDELPQALQNILIECNNDVHIGTPKTGSLLPWARKGVLLWNVSPTGLATRPRSHLGIGWRVLTEEILETVWCMNPNTVFVLWGDLAKTFKTDLPPNALTISGASPTISSAYQGFFASHPFSRVNAMLEANGSAPIDWRL